MRKFYIKLILLALALVIPFGLIACDSKGEHVHFWSGWTSDGETTHTRTCLCGETETQKHRLVNGVCAVCGYTATTDGHIHSWSEWISAGDATHSRRCSCGETEYENHDMSGGVCTVCGYAASADGHVHSWSAWESDGDTTHSRSCACDEVQTEDHDMSDGVCTVCGYTSEQTDEHTHTYNVQNTESAHLKSAATCTSPAVYYYSCSCGQNGTETFESGSALGHSFTAYVSDSNATCTNDGTKTSTCDRSGCNETAAVTDTGSKLSHLFTTYVSDNNATCGDNCTETAACSRGCGATDTREIPDSATGMHDYSDGVCTVCGEAYYSKGLSFSLNYDNVSYSVNGIGSCTDKNIYIPEAYNDKPVTIIDNYAFYSCSDITGVTIPDSVTSVGADAFSDCSGITSVTIGNGVTSIGAGAFLDCSSLTSITVSSDNTVYHSAGNCLIETESKKLILGCNGSIIPTDGSVTSIDDSAFYGCSGLTGIAIPDSVTSIGLSVFSDCSGLTSVTIGSGVTSIGGWAFYGCIGLTSIIVSNDNAKYHSSGNCLIETESKKLILGSNNSIIPTDGSVTSIDESAFSGCTGLMSVTIPDSVTYIGDHMFDGCTGLTNITIPDGVTYIGYGAFYRCTGLKNITIPDSVTRIGDSAFEKCFGYTSVTIGNSVTNIGKNAFEPRNFELTRINYTGDLGSWCNISGLENLMSSGKAGKELFINNVKIDGTLTIPDSVTYISSCAFFGCKELTSISI